MSFGYILAYHQRTYANTDTDNPCFLTIQRQIKQAMFNIEVKYKYFQC